MLTAREIFEEIQKLADTDIPARGKTTADRLVAIKALSVEGIASYGAAHGELKSDLTAEAQDHVCCDQSIASRPIIFGNETSYIKSDDPNGPLLKEMSPDHKPQDAPQQFDSYVSQVVRRHKRRKAVMVAVEFLNAEAKLHLTLGQIGGVTERLMVGEPTYVGDGSRYFTLTESDRANVRDGSWRTARQVNLVDRGAHSVQSATIKDE